MNIPTIGALLRGHALHEFSIMSKVVSSINAVVPENFHLSQHVTGDEILEWYQQLPYDLQQHLFDTDLIDRVEEQSLYREIKVVSDTQRLKEEYHSDLSSALILDLCLICLFFFMGVAILYRQNTIKFGDQIEANVFTTIVTVIKYLVFSLV